MSLEQNRRFYEFGLEFVARQCDRGPRDAVAAIAATAHWASCHNPGSFADGTLENTLFQIGRDEVHTGYAARRLEHNAQRPRTLHVATRVFGIGGHTRVVSAWIANDHRSDHAVVLTDQVRTIPDVLTRTLSATGSGLTCLPIGASIMHRATLLRRLSAEFDRVILHTHPDDTIPVLAFAAPGGPPVALFNHAHFSFCLGASVSDLTINTLPYFHDLTRRYRFPRLSKVFTGLPVTDPIDDNPINKAAAKAHLGLGPATPVLMSIAHESYFRPIDGWDFFATAATILERNPNAFLLIVGVTSDSGTIPASFPRTRCLFAGPVDNPLPYYRAADICLESFPMPSLGAVMEAVLHGEAFPVPVYGPAECIVRVHLTPFLAYPYRASDQTDYIEYVSRLIKTRTQLQERSRELRLRLGNHVRQFPECLQQINELIDDLTHVPNEIGTSRFIDNYDTRILGELYPLSVASRINEVCPLATATRLQYAAAVWGLHSPRAATSALSCRVWNGLVRRLPGHRRNPAGVAMPQPVLSQG